MERGSRLLRVSDFGRKVQSFEKIPSNVTFLTGVFISAQAKNNGLMTGNHVMAGKCVEQNTFICI